jgi:hypothetical protein
MDNMVLSWILDTLVVELQDIVCERVALHAKPRFP